LRQRVEQFLSAQGEIGSFLEPPASRPVLTIDPPVSERPGTVLGPYKLMEQIGEGGMGLVFVAEQQHPMRRKVALKIIKPGMDSQQVIARFEAERQALALMDHQNIAKVFDAGTTPGEPGCVSAGRPYFVMELVHGIPITDYCDAHRLTPRERLELFLPVCHAIQHAHQKGIIHRDIKPSNILVTMYDDKPVPKVIDFGVAKAIEQRLTEKTVYTQFGTLVGTFEYMSPEQAEKNAFGVDTRSDVYALGVLLYELLTGTTPLERHRLCEAAYADIVRLIKEEEPPPPSTRLSSFGAALTGISQQRGSAPEQLTELVRGELDWIVMRCLEKDRTRRYETANGLARDVERYLKDEPVEACPPTAGYKVRKFARKHRKLLASAAGFVVLLLLGVAASTWQAVRATQAERVAVAERDEKEHARQAEAKQRAAAVRSEQVAQQERDKAQQQRDEAKRQRDEVRALNQKLQATQAELQRTLYAVHMNLAQHAWEAAAVERVQKLLERHRPKLGETDLRGFEWDYLNRLCHAELLTLKGHSGSAPADRSVAFSPDGKRVAFTSGNYTDPKNRAGEVKVCDAQTGRELLTCRGHTGPVTGVAYSPDGKRLASASGRWDARVVKVWDAQTGQELLTCKGNAKDSRSVAYSPDGKRLASASEDQVKMWDAQTGQELRVLEGHTRSVVSVAFSPDGKCLASASFDKTVKVWDAQTGQELLTCKGHTGDVQSVAYSPDGKRLASSGAGAKWGEVKVWDTQTGQEILSIKGGGRSVAFSPDGRRLASTGVVGVEVWDAQTGQELYTFKHGHGGLITSVVFSPDGTRLASADFRGTVKIWDATSSPEARTFRGSPSHVSSVAFSPDGKRLAAGGGTWDDTKQAYVSGELKVWDAQTGKELLSCKNHSGAVGSVTFSPDGKRLAGAAADKAVKVWDAQTGQEILTLKMSGGERNAWVAYSPDGKRLASTDQQTVRMWDAQTGQELLSLQGRGSVAFSPDGKRLATGSLDNRIKVWDSQTGQAILTLNRFGGSLVFSPDGKLLASTNRTGNLALAGPRAPGEVKVWDAQTGQELRALKGHNGVVSVVFSADGKRLASTSWDGTVKIWDAQTGQELLSLHGGKSVVFSPDGHWLATNGPDGNVTIWDATPLPVKP
jgi:WD40 repeat protein/serine/threonine protein kinase